MSGLPVLVFPGQGAQKVGMGKDLADALPEVAELYKLADDVLGFGITRMIFEGPDESLVDTAVQQPALVLTSCAVAKAVEVLSGAPVPAAAAGGLSLGEYSALACVDALKLEDALKVVRRRGEEMKAACDANPSSMYAILKLDEATVRAACDQAAAETGKVVSPCNFNGGGQIVIGGHVEGLKRAGEICKEKKGRVMPLKVAGAFHTELMQPAADGLREALAAAPIARPRAAVYANVSAQANDEPGAIRDALRRQLTHPVLWEQTVKAMVAAGHGFFLELGPGQSVCNMIRKIHPEAKTVSLGTLEEVKAYVGA